jgi:hypothetical protein
VKSSPDSPSVQLLDGDVLLGERGGGPDHGFLPSPDHQNSPGG